MSNNNALNDILVGATAAYNQHPQVATAAVKRTLTHSRPLTSSDIDSLTVLEFAAQDILLKYHAAMRQMETRLETLDQDLKLRQSRNPIHHIESRMKSVPSIFEKLGRYGKSQTLDSMERYIMDIAGLRVIVSYVQDVYDILHYLEHQDDLEVVTVKDYITNPKPNGYRSLHMIVKIPVYFLSGRQHVPVEIQIRTIAMDFWASLEHDLKYKAVRETSGLNVGEELKQCSNIIKEAEDRMQVLARALEQNAPADKHEVNAARQIDLSEQLR
ncbi:MULTISPECIES: GTP pyrophosphokinase family protein [unclassified Adlercreutzia]|uniref:GTP pyrophosphokinase n=1 Tax=unclassified Adlercreutzia TaxID=2636013 RepID=UPI0013EDE24F|nr:MULTISPECIES: (p)ppGpp synthetase [unclassified Adlercreutzia]